MSNSSKRDNTAFPPEFDAFLPPDIRDFLSAKVLLLTTCASQSSSLIFVTVVVNARAHQFSP